MGHLAGSLIHQSPGAGAFARFLRFLVIAYRLVDIGFKRPGAGVAAVPFCCFIEGVEGGAAIAVVYEGFSFVAPGSGAARVDDQGAAIGVDGPRVIAYERTCVAQTIPGLKAL